MKRGVMQVGARPVFDCIQDYICEYPNETMYFLIETRDGKAYNYDGPHSEPVGVARAKRILRGLFPDKRTDIYTMLTLGPIPNIPKRDTP